ncbi:MAG: hypothetical protein JKX82_05990 [Oleispira sp.]|nr:hypothetical protein [Oleispira sp.]
MSRPMRLEFPDADRQQFLNVLNHVCQRYNCLIRYCSNIAGMGAVKL